MNIMMMMTTMIHIAVNDEEYDDHVVAVDKPGCLVIRFFVGFICHW